MVIINIISMIYLYGIFVDLDVFKTTNLKGRTTLMSHKVFQFYVINNYCNIIDSCIYIWFILFGSVWDWLRKTA